MGKLSKAVGGESVEELEGSEGRIEKERGNNWNEKRGELKRNKRKAGKERRR